MINFGDTESIAKVNVSEPIGEANKIAHDSIMQGLASIEKSAMEESMAMKQVAEEMYKTGKVDFMGGDVEAFKKKYKTLKSELVNELRHYGSVQQFLTNGGYDKIAEFKQNVETSDEYKNGIINKMHYNIVNNALASGRTKIKYGDNGGIENWLAGKGNIDFKGFYNENPVDPRKWVIDEHSDKTTHYSTDEIAQRMKLENYHPDDIKAVVESETKAPTKTFFKTIRDDIKYAQIAAIKENKEADRQNKITIQQMKDANDIQVAAMRTDSKNKRNIAWTDLIGNRDRVDEISFKKLPFFAKQKIGGFDPTLEKNEGEHEVLVDGQYQTEKGSTVNVQNKANEIIEKIPGEAYLDVKKQRWVIPVNVKRLSSDGKVLSPVRTTYYKPIDLTSEVTKRDLLLMANKDFSNIDLDYDLRTPPPQVQKVPIEEVVNKLNSAFKQPK